MIQDIEKSKLNNEYQNADPTENSVALCYKDGKILCSIINGVVSFPNCSSADLKEYVYLFSVDENSFFLCSVEPFSDFEFHNIRELRECKNKKEIYAGVTGYHLFCWYSKNKFCPACGSKAFHSKNERALVCSCGNVIYPRIDIAVIVGVINKGKILLTRYSKAHSAYRKPALVAGFAEIGETIEQTVEREVFEETSLKVKNITYCKSQPWGFTGGMLFGFFCEVDGSADVKIDENELSEAFWASPDEIDFDDNGVSLTEYMIGLFKSNKGAVI